MWNAPLAVVATLLVSTAIHPPPDELLRAIEINAFIDAFLKPTPETAKTLAHSHGAFNVSTAVGPEEIVAIVELPPPPS